MGTTPRIRVSWPRVVLLLLAVLNTVGALAGAWGLASGTLDLGTTVNQRLPWQSDVVAAAALALLVALPNGVLAAVAVLLGRYTGLVGIAVGAALVVWILLELAFIRELSFLHPLYVAVGLIMIWAGFRAVRLDLGVEATSLVQELRDVLVDLPRFVAAPLIRRRHLRCLPQSRRSRLHRACDRGGGVGGRARPRASCVLRPRARRAHARQCRTRRRRHGRVLPERRRRRLHPA